MTLKLVVKTMKMNPDAQLPTYATDGAAGADLRSCEDVIVPAGERRLVSTGIAIELPPGYEAQIRPRSGLALKSGITVLNSPGTIDSDYRGAIGVILYNTGKHDFAVNKGDRIAQMVIARHEVGQFEFAEELSTAERGEGGFGSTGTK